MSSLFDIVTDALTEKRNQLKSWANDDQAYLDRPAYGPGLMGIEYSGEPGASFYAAHGKANGADFDIADIDKWRRDDGSIAKIMHMQMIKERYGDKPYSRQQNADMWQAIVDQLMDPTAKNADGYSPSGRTPEEIIKRWPYGSKHRPIFDR
jgi:hypothetical protein